MGQEHPIRCVILCSEKHLTQSQRERTYERQIHSGDSDFLAAGNQPRDPHLSGKEHRCIDCDVMAVTDKLTGYEIKSDQDNYARLQDQVKAYDRFF